MRYRLVKLVSLAAAIALGGWHAPALAQEPQASPPRPLVYPDGEQFSMHSRITGRTYVIFVARPRMPEPPFSMYHLPAPAKYPAVYSTDADLGFLMSAELGRLMQGGEDVPPYYSIGIGYGTTDFMKFMELRQKDLTPTVDTKAPPPISTWGMGGSEAFLRFIQEELKPEIARRYPVDNSHTFISGLSHGGLFALWTLFTHPQAFEGYIALDPANWDNWAGERIEAAFAEHRQSLAGKRLYLGTESGNYSDPRLKQFSAFIRDRWLKFCDTVRSRNYEGLTMKCEALEGESHFSAPGPGTTHGLRFVMPLNGTLVPPPAMPAPPPAANR